MRHGNAAIFQRGGVQEFSLSAVAIIRFLIMHIPWRVSSGVIPPSHTHAYSVTLEQNKKNEK